MGRIVTHWGSYGERKNDRVRQMIIDLRLGWGKWLGLMFPMLINRL